MGEEAEIHDAICNLQGGVGIARYAMFSRKFNVFRKCAEIPSGEGVSFPLPAVSIQRGLLDPIRNFFLQFADIASGFNLVTPVVCYRVADIQMRRHFIQCP